MARRMKGRTCGAAAFRPYGVRTLGDRSVFWFPIPSGSLLGWRVHGYLRLGE